MAAGVAPVRWVPSADRGWRPTPDRKGARTGHEAERPAVAPADDSGRAFRAGTPSLSRNGPGLPAALLLGVLGPALAGCGYGVNPPFSEYSAREQRLRDQFGTVSGKDGFTLFGGRKSQQAGTDGSGGGIGVNAYLWRGALQTLDFMPLASADPFGGLIITDWYQPPESPDERLKVHVLIMDRALRADAVKVSVFRQTRQGGGWADAPVDPKTSTALEDKILTKARELRIATAQAAG